MFYRATKYGAKKTGLAAVVMLIALTSCAHHPDAATDEPVPVTFEPPNQSITAGDHRLHIERNYASEDEARLIKAAEETYPEKSAILGAARYSRTKDNHTERLWWYDSFDEVRLPYAITGDAIKYYYALSEDIRTGNVEKTGGIKMLSTSFNYVVNVEKRERFKMEGHTFRDVSVITMSMSWGQYCGSLCAMGFDKKRVVVFDRGGNIEGVFLDGKGEVIVS